MTRCSGRAVTASSRRASSPFRRSRPCASAVARYTPPTGPFAETKEQLGGFFLIEARDLDEACAIAAKFPPARVATLEVRPVQELRHSRDQRGLPR